MNYVPSIGEVACLESIRLNQLQGGSLHLFVTNHAPLIGDVAATYAAIEAAFGGYAAQTTNSWGASYVNAANAAETDETVRVFTATGAGLPVTVYGSYFLNSSGVLVYADLFQTPVTLSSAGQTVAYQPIFTAAHT